MARASGSSERFGQILEGHERILQQSQGGSIMTVPLI